MNDINFVSRGANLGKIFNSIKKKIGLYSIALTLYLPLIVFFGKLLTDCDLLVKLWTFLSSKLFINTLSFSVKEALLSACLSLLLAFPGAYFFGNFDFPGKRLLRSIMILPFMMPGILIVLGLVIFYGNNGFFNQFLASVSNNQLKFAGLYGFWGIILAHSLYNFPFCIRVLSESWERINPNLKEAAAMLGSSKLNTWRRVTLPLLMPTLSYLFFLVFTYSFLSFTIVLVFGGYLYKTFEVLIYIEYNNKLQFEQAAIIILLQTIILAVILLLQSFIGKRVQYQSKLVGQLAALNWQTTRLQTVTFISYGLFLILFFVSPFLAIIYKSFFQTEILSIANYRNLFTTAFSFSVGQPFLIVLRDSILLGGFASLIVVCIAYYVARSRRHEPWGGVDLLFQLPIGISFMAFAIGLASIFGELLNYRLLIVWAHVFLAFPLVYSILRTARRELNESIIENAILLGSTPGQVFRRVELPLMRRPLSTAFAYGMAISLGDLAAVLVFGKGQLVTLSVAVYRLIGHYRFAQATALGSLLIFISLLLFLSVENSSIFIGSREDR
ncbi:MAG TPA: iron ABC transporter permease [Bacillota bacterium]|nr:iron ABC transporter permease [Bacillota bacterium]HOL10627.1 iron ABC transporter permease [Bacillota bacterium]HPO98830.1 iron ABC transporter permease [Bacillota bacterium]